MNTINVIKARSQTFAQTHPALKFLVLFGSRARGEEDPSSDWDFAFLSDSLPSENRPPFWFPGSELLDSLTSLLHISDQKIDIVDLSTCSDIVAHFVARDGQVIYEQSPGEFADFQRQALKSKAELQQFRQTQREKVLQTLKRWGL